MDLGKIVSFSEGGNEIYPQAVANGVAMDMSYAKHEMVAPPIVSAGQDKITITVNITYKLK